MWSTIPESIKILHTLFKKHNKSLFVVGGSVRDFLNKETPKDFDLATDATPEEVLTITKGYKTKLQGEAFGVVVVYTKDGEFEIATFREDIYGDKLGETRNPEVKFTTIDKDVLRRDLTFNALFYDLDKQEIIDLVGGVEDIKNKITRFVGEPTLRIKEDPLRILRLFRFAKRYDFSIDEKSFSAIKELSASLSIITKERIWDEIKKAYKQSINFMDYMNLLIDTGVAEIIFPNTILNKFIITSWYRKGISLEVYFAKLLSNDNRDTLAKKLVSDFKMDIAFSRKVIFLIDLLYLNTNNVLELYKKKIVSAISTDDILEWYRIIGLMKYSEYRAFLLFKISVSGDELKKKGFKEKALGDEIKRLELENFKQLLNEV
jgi:tRNA nucleotidyltransferase/poly(A) polymerase